jgi:hypothetical protein
MCKRGVNVGGASDLLSLSGVRFSPSVDYRVYGLDQDAKEVFVLPSEFWECFPCELYGP